jgi:hypothetical protein
MKTFSPPVDDNFAWADYRDTSPPHQLFGYFRQGDRAKNLFYLKTGVFTNVDPLDPGLVEKVYYGGHIYEITDEESSVLVAAGYGDYISG